MTRGSDEPAQGPVCPFCGAGWTREMLAQLDRFTLPSSCACCGGAQQGHAEPLPPTTEDLRCAACSRTIYRALAPEGGRRPNGTGTSM